MNMTFFYIAILLMALVIMREILKNKYNVDFDKIDISKIFSGVIVSKAPVKKIAKTNSFQINKKTGSRSLTMLDSGINKATVMATLRQITGIDYVSAKQIVYSTPKTFMINISDKEADLTKQALEFVGAKIEIK